MTEGTNNGQEVESGGQERRPPSAADILRWQKEEALRRKAKKGKKKTPKIDKHLTLEETMALEAKRKRAHPAGHQRTGAPPGTTTVGEGSRGPKPKED